MARDISSFVFVSSATARSAFSTHPRNPREYLAGIAASSGIATVGCLSPYDFGELDTLARTIAEDLTANTPYEYRADQDGNEDPGNEVYVGWAEGMLNVSLDAAFAESEFCRDEYASKDLQQDPERMENAKNEAFDTLLTEHPHLTDVYFYALRDTMGELEHREQTSYYAFFVDFQSGSIWNEYGTEQAQRLYEALTTSDAARQTASQQFRTNGRFECGAPAERPGPPE